MLYIKNGNYKGIIMKQLSTALSIIAISISLPSYADSFTARHMGQGFTSLTHDFTSSISNPALLTKFDQDDDFYLSLNIGVRASDEYEVIDNGEDIADELEVLEDEINNLTNLAPGQIPAAQADLHQDVDELVAKLEAVDEKPVQLGIGFNALMIIPTNTLSSGLFVNQYGRVGVVIDYDDVDETTLDDAIDDLTLVDIDDLATSAIGVGYNIVEAGLMFGYQAVKSDAYDLSIGTKIKFQRVDVFYNNIGISDFDDDEFDITDDEFLTDNDGVNLDLGLYVNWGDERQWSFALIADNILSQDVELVIADPSIDNINLSVDLKSTIGVGYQQEWFSISAELDLTDRVGFKELSAPKYASVGAQVNLGEHMQLRVGARTDLNDVEDDVVTAGFGLSPWDVFSIDVGAFTGGNDNVGIAVQLGLKI